MSALGVLPLGRQFRLRGSTALLLGTNLQQPADGVQRVGGNDGKLNAELGAAWSIPTALTWLHAAVLADVVTVARRAFERSAQGDQTRSWSVVDVEAAPGLAVAVSRWGVHVASFTRYSSVLHCAERTCQSRSFGLVEIGASVDADGLSLGVPIGLLLHGKLSYWGADFGGGVFWLTRRFRVGALWHSSLIHGWTASAWPESEFNLRIDWLAGP